MNGHKLRELLGDEFLDAAPAGTEFDLQRGTAWIPPPFFLHCTRTGPREWVAEQYTRACSAH